MAAPGSVSFAPGSAAAVEMSGAPYRVSMDHLGLDGYSPTMDATTAQYHHHQHAHSAAPPHHHHHPNQQRHGPIQHPQQQFGRVSSQPHQHQEPRNGGGVGGGQFGILAPTTVPQDAFTGESHGSLEGALEGPNADGSKQQSHSQLSTRMVVDPPDLAAWREKLFNVDDMIILTNDQFETYFPHVDNVYSHRSTQRYKRKPFVSHYWDCRMKGRPPGTPKSDDPNKKKRKRSARERDLCDVKIKITEYAPGAQIQLDDGTSPSSFAQQQQQQQLLPPPFEVGAGQKFWTIQRVNGNGGNGKGDGVAGPHRHTLAKSDEIKKNSVQRYMAKQEKETKKTQVGFCTVPTLTCKVVECRDADESGSLRNRCRARQQDRLWRRSRSTPRTVT